MRKLVSFFLVLLLLAAFPSWARNAQTMLVPTRIVMEHRDRQFTAVVKNVGDAVGDYTLELVDMKMREDGAVVPYEAGETPQYSAIPYLHVAPRSFTLKPGEYQNVRLMLRKPENLAEGEYRAHLLVRIVDRSPETAPAPGEHSAIAVKMTLAITIPVIVRTGNTAATVAIDQPKLTRDPAGKPAVTLYLTRSGNRSVMGDIAVTCSQAAGGPRVIKTVYGVPVYRTLERRFVSVPLDETPKDVNLADCNLGITYSAQQGDGGKILAEAHLNAR